MCRYSRTFLKRKASRALQRIFWEKGIAPAGTAPPLRALGGHEKMPFSKILYLKFFAELFAKSSPPEASASPINPNLSVNLLHQSVGVICFAEELGYAIVAVEEVEVAEEGFHSRCHAVFGYRR